MGVLFICILAIEGTSSQTAEVVLSRLGLKISVRSVPGDHLVEVHLVAVEVGAVHAGELHLAAHGEAAAAAHAGAVDHNGVHAHGGGDLVLLGQQANFIIIRGPMANTWSNFTPLWMSSSSLPVTKP